MLDGGKCILQLRGVRPFLSDKYDLTQHPNYKYTSDADPKNAFDIEAFLHREMELQPDEMFDSVDMDVEEQMEKKQTERRKNKVAAV